MTEKAESNMNPIGIMQGRLLSPIDERIQGFPVTDWQLEFSLARQAGLYCIEWIFEEPGQEQNPITSDLGIKEIEKLSKEHNIQVLSVCADYYMTQRIILPDGQINKKIANHFRWFIEQAKKLNIKYVVLPFVDSSSLSSPVEQKGLLVFLEESLSFLEEVNIEVHLETDFSPKVFKSILHRLDHPLVCVNYDIGNSASLGYNPEEELSMIAPRLGSVHVKDRILGGSTVPLGQGNADFQTCFKLILESGFDRWFILQAARQTNLNEIDLAIHNRCFIKNYIQSITSADKHLTKQKNL